MTKPKKRAKGTYDKLSAKIGFHEWNLDVSEKMAEYFKDALKEGFAIATEEYECFATFACDSLPDNEPITSPGLIHVGLPIGPEEYEDACWDFSLTDLVENMIGFVEHGEGGYIDDVDKPPLVAVRDELRRLADVLDAAMEREP